MLDQPIAQVIPQTTILQSRDKHFEPDLIDSMPHRTANNPTAARFDNRFIEMVLSVLGVSPHDAVRGCACALRQSAFRLASLP
jgi:hypothetical protein